MLDPWRRFPLSSHKDRRVSCEPDTMGFENGGLQVEPPFKNTRCKWYLFIDRRILRSTEWIHFFCEPRAPTTPYLIYAGAAQRKGG